MSAPVPDDADPVSGDALQPSPARRPAPADAWTSLRQHTPARIALGRTGASLPTAELLRFGLAHAQARDAVHQPFDADTLAAQLRAEGFDTLHVASAAADRAAYLRRPDLGRRLADESRARLMPVDGGLDLLTVVGDGLSSQAVHRQAGPLLLALRPWTEAARWRCGPVVLARQARVALGDEIGECLGARMVLMLVGERPGLSSPDSLGAYLTFAPRRGRSDAERNCVSNIRPEGQAPAEAARRIAWLAQAALQRGATGVGLKDDSETQPLPAPSPIADRLG